MKEFREELIKEFGLNPREIRVQEKDGVERIFLYDAYEGDGKALMISHYAQLNGYNPIKEFTSLVIYKNKKAD